MPGSDATAAKRSSPAARARRWRTRADQALAYAAQVNGGNGRAGGRIARPLVSDLIAGPL